MADWPACVWGGVIFLFVGVFLLVEREVKMACTLSYFHCTLVSLLSL